MLPGNTADKTTLRAFLHKIQEQYGKAERIWIMDRGIPTEEVLTEMRPAIHRFPTTDGRWLIFARYTQPEKDHRILINLLGMHLPPQRPPRITHEHNLIQS